MDGKDNTLAYGGRDVATQTSDGDTEYKSWIDRLQSGNSTAAGTAPLAIEDFYRPRHPQGISKYYDMSRNSFCRNEGANRIHALIGAMAETMIPSERFVFQQAKTQADAPAKLEGLVEQLKLLLRRESYGQYVVTTKDDPAACVVQWEEPHYYKRLGPDAHEAALNADVTQFVSDLRGYVQGRLQQGAVIAR